MVNNNNNNEARISNSSRTTDATYRIIRTMSVNTSGCASLSLLDQQFHTLPLRWFLGTSPASTRLEKINVQLQQVDELLLGAFLLIPILAEHFVGVQWATDQTIEYAVTALV